MMIQLGLSLWRPKHNLQPTFLLVISSMVTGCGGFNSSGGYQNRVKGDKRNVSQLNRHNNTWPGNVREMSNQLLIHDCPFLKNIGQGIPIFPRFFTDFRLVIISFSLTNSSDNSENFESSLVVWKNQRLHELASIWHSRYFWKMIAVLPTFSPAIRHLETLRYQAPLRSFCMQFQDEALYFPAKFVLFHDRGKVTRFARCNLKITLK